MFKKFLKFIFPVFILLAFMSMDAKAVEEYPLWVGNQQVTSENLSGAAGDGSWSFSGNSSGGTLTLNNATITASHNMNFEDYPDWRYRANISCDTKNFDLTIQLIGNNVLSGSKYGIYASQNTYTITGPGSLDATNDNAPIGSYQGGLSITNGANITAKSLTERGIETTGLLTISDSTISASAAGNSASAAILVAGVNDLVISNSNLNLTNCNSSYLGHVIRVTKDITISNSTINIEKSDTNEYGGDGICNYSGVGANTTILNSSINIIGGGGNGMLLYGSVSISNSSIDITGSGGNGISSGGNGQLSILDSSINITGSGDSGISSGSNGQLSILGDSTVTSEGATGAINVGNINNTDQLLILEPVEARFNRDCTTVILRDSSKATRAVITTKKYTIKFVNYDGTVLQTDELAYDATPEYTGETPTKPADDQYTYTFAGWDSEIVPVTGETTYTATYSQTTNKYTVEFVNYDNALLESKQVDYGVTPEYTGETPTKPADAQYTYSFDAWTPSIVPVAAAATYTATYNSTVNEYTITFVDEDGTELQSSNVAYGVTPEYTGRTPTKPADDQYTYTFAGWDPEIVPVAGETTYTAIYEAEARTHHDESEGDDDDVTPISDDEKEKTAQETEKTEKSNVLDEIKTGDEINSLLWLSLATISFIGLVFIIPFRKSHRLNK